MTKQMNELVERVAKVISPDVFKYEPLIGEHDKLMLKEIVFAKAKAAIKETYQADLDALHGGNVQWTDKEVVISEYLIERLKQLEG